MIRLLTFILITAALVFCTVWFADNPGRMTIVWLGYRFDGSIGMVTLALLALTAVLVLLWRGLDDHCQFAGLAWTPFGQPPP